ncbi:MAG: alpha/beta fold hydrolase [Tannerellaceae bacterium]|nr:alpha/beta fold hydrolase [Tannerellaceae bacterium]
MLFIVCLAFPALWGQEITGDWNGILKVQGIQLRVVFHISQTGDAYSATMDSPDQNAFGIPATAASYGRPALKLSISNLGVEYEGTLQEDGNIKGTFRQMGQSFPLDLQRATVEKEKPSRPQEPSRPYPYAEEDVAFENRDADIQLAGTLSLPRREGRFPAVVLISGSGAQTRDEEVMGHKPFLIIADYLTRNGIAVLRFDDRGTAASTGNFATATTLDFSTDAEAAVRYLLTRPEIDHRKIGLIGHSEGGVIAPMVAVRCKDVAFIVLLAGLGIPGDELLLLQNEALSRAAGMGEEDLQTLSAFYRGLFDVILQAADVEELQAGATTRIKALVAEHPDVKPEGVSEETFISAQVSQLVTPWVKYLLAYDPAPTLEQVRCPVLAIGGDKDLQVPANVNLEAIHAALLRGGNHAVTVKELPGLNHLFQECTTGLPSEYATIEQTFSPVALNEILSWLALQIP